MNPLVPITFLVTFIPSIVVQMVFFLLDDRTENHTLLDLHLKRYWHWAGGAIHIWAGTIMGYTFGMPWGVLTAACTWYFMDGALNTWVLHKGWWSVGTTADIDKAQRWIAIKLHLDYQIVSATLKNGLLVAALIGVIFL